MLAGIAAVAIGIPIGLQIVILAGYGLIALAALLYAGDIIDIVLRANVPHRPPQVWMLCAVLFAVATVGLGMGSALGAGWGEAAVFAALIGWAGSAVLAHMHHIGVRVFVTLFCGDEDETRPGEILFAPLTWITLVLYESAAIAGTIALLRKDDSLLLLAAYAGLASFIAMVVHAPFVFRSIMKSKQPYVV